MTSRSVSSRPPPRRRSRGSKSSTSSTNRASPATASCRSSPCAARRGIKTGTGDRQSTNYVPKLEIVGWANRPGDLVFVPRGNSGPSQNSLPLTSPHSSTQAGNGTGSTAGNQQARPWAGESPPHTGSTLAQPPLRKALEASVQQGQWNGGQATGQPNPNPPTQGWPGETAAVGQPKTVPSADDFG